MRKGQTLYAISRMYDVTVDEIKQWNGLQSNDLKPGMNLQVLGAQAIVVENPAVEEKPQVSFHEVDSGETLYAIARKYDIPVKDLMQYNLIEDGDSLAVGQKLQLQKGQDPEFKERTINPEYHEVVSGDTMYSIAKKYNLTIKDLMSMNGKN